MARNTTLLAMLQDLRAEIGVSGNPAHNSAVREQHVRMLQRTQELLWEGYDWPHLRVQRYGRAQAGERYYDPPKDIPIDRLEHIHVRDGDEWNILSPAIQARHLAAFDSFKDERSWPPECWQVYEGDMVEIWPIPATNGAADDNGALQYTGIRKLRPLVADSDRADLDDRLIVLSAAGEYLVSRGDASAPLKMQAASQRLKSLKGNQSKIKQFPLFGAGQIPTTHQPYIPRIHYRDRETN